MITTTIELPTPPKRLLRLDCWTMKVDLEEVDFSGTYEDAQCHCTTYDGKLKLTVTGASKVVADGLFYNAVPKQ